MPLSVGQTLNNRYRIVRLLGQGGFGAVYRAWDTNLGVQCAVKENLELSQAAQGQFKKEASLLATLHHPNLPRVTDHFFIPGQGQYLVMDFIEGEDLRSMLESAGGPLPEKQVLQWIAQVSDALEYMHSQQPPVIHRDIKPANIRITPKGRAVLVDFGIAKVYNPNLATTQGARAVTPGFSPQEQYGQGRTDARSDVYALGAMLYTLLTGEVPVESVLRSSTALVTPTKINPSISSWVESAILKAMEVSPPARYQSVAEFRAALENMPAIQVTGPASKGAPVLAAAPVLKPRSARLPRWTRFAAVAALLVILGLGGYLISRNLSKGVPSPTSTTGALGSEPVKVTSAGSGLATSRSTVVTGQASPTATRLLPPTPTPILAPTVTSMPVVPTSTYLQGKIAYVNRQNGIQIIVQDLSGAGALDVKLEPVGSGGSESPWWSPSGAWLAFTNISGSGYRRVMVIGALPGSPPKDIGTGLLGSSPTWAPDEKRIAIFGSGGNAGKLLFVDAFSGQSESQLDTGISNAALPAWSPDGKLIAFATRDDANSDIYIIPVAGGSPTLLTDYSGEDYAPAWSPDGTWIAFQSDRQGGGHLSEIWIMDANGKNRRQITKTPGDAWSRAPTWSPDGKWIAYVSGKLGQEYGELYVISVSGGDPIPLTETGGNIYDWRPSWGR